MGGVIQYEHYLYAGGMMFGIYKTFSDGTTQLRYLHVDNQNSLVAVTDESGNVVERLAYDPFGKRRFVTGADDPGNTISGQTTEHGYTLEEMLDTVGVTNLNGRMYDPLLGRFISADPHIQSPYNLQSYNRYSYAWNDPMGGIDPSGYSLIGDIVGGVGDVLGGVGDAIGGLFHAGQSAWKDVWHSQVGQTAIQIVIGNTLGPEAVSMYDAAYVSYEGGSWQDAARAAIISYSTAMAFQAVGDATAHGPISDPTLYAENIAGHALVGCVSAAAAGGGCGSGAMAAGFGAAATPWVWNNVPGQYQLAVIAVVGGTASVIGGGRFANGAITAAYGYMYNAQAVNGLTGGVNDAEAQAYSLSQMVEDYAATLWDKLTIYIGYGGEGTGGEGGAFAIGAAFTPSQFELSFFEQTVRTYGYTIGQGAYVGFSTTDNLAGESSVYTINSPVGGVGYSASPDGNFSEQYNGPGRYGASYGVGRTCQFVLNNLHGGC